MIQLASDRLVIRPFLAAELDEVSQLLDVELGEALPPRERGRWLAWTTLAYEQLARMHQPPYGDMAMTLAGSGELVGACGLVPILMPLSLVDGLGTGRETPETARFEPAVGLYWALAPAYRGQGYATEAGIMLMHYGFEGLRLGRMVATTTYDNVASQAVMERLGMRIGRNRFPDPPWLQVVGELRWDEWAVGRE